MHLDETIFHYYQLSQKEFQIVEARGPRVNEEIVPQKRKFSRPMKQKTTFPKVVKK